MRETPKGGGQYHFGLVATKVLIVVAGFVTATQWIAAEFNYSVYLGSPLFVLADYPVYAPYQVVVWGFEFSQAGQQEFAIASLMVLGSVVLMFAVNFFVSIFREQVKTDSRTFGSARWATESDIRKAGLLEDKGVFLGRLANGRYLRHDGPENCAVIAPPRSGKGVGMVMPTLLSWTESVVVYDLRSEAWSVTSGHRSRFSTCLYFNPVDGRSAKYNPLLAVRKGEHEVRDVQNIADILVDPSGSQESRDHWKLSSFTLLVGTILHIVYAGEDKSLAGVVNFLSDPHHHFYDCLKIMLRTRHLGNSPHPVVAGVAREMLNKNERELADVVSTAMGFLSLYRDPLVAHNTRTSDFAIADLMHGDKPISLYLAVPPSDQSRLKPLMRLMITQMLRQLMDVKVTPGRKHYQNRLLLMLDEFASLGRMDVLEDALPVLGGYGVKSMLIMHGVDQLNKVYGTDNAILTACQVRVVYAANDEKTARRFSDLAGTQTVQREQTHFSGNRLAPWLGNKSVSTQEMARPLITLGEITQLPQEDELVFVASCPPIRAKKVRYYDDPIFADRLLGEWELPSSWDVNAQDEAPSPSSVMKTAIDDGHWASRVPKYSAVDSKRQARSPLQEQQEAFTPMPEEGFLEDAYPLGPEHAKPDLADLYETYADEMARESLDKQNSNKQIDRGWTV